MSVTTSPNRPDTHRVPIVLYVRALIWPAVVVVGVFWLFRSKLGSLVTQRRVKSVEAAGVKVELEQVAEVLKESVQDTREEVARADDPEERERAAPRC
jgi:hypothetical protein